MPEAWRDPNLADRSRPIITTCETGEMAALGGKLLKDMGFTNVRILKGGTVAWKEAGYSTNAPGVSDVISCGDSGCPDFVEIDDRRKLVASNVAVNSWV